MKKQIILFLILILSIKSFSQQSDLGFVGLSAGYVQKGFGFSLHYDYFLTDKSYVKGEVMFSFSKDKVTNLEIEVPFNTVLINPGYYHEVFGTVRDQITFNAGAGLSFGYEVLNNGNKELSSGAIITSRSRFVFGGFIALESRIFINDSWTASVFYKQFYHESDIGKFMPYTGASISYTLF